MKNAKYFIIALAIVCAICAGFYCFSEDNKGKEEPLTEIETLITKDLNKNYPKSSREVVKLYNRIVKCYYGDNPTEAELGKLVDQMLCLLDDELLLVNPRTEYYKSVVNDIASYKSQNKQLVSTDVCDSSEVVSVTDEKNGQKEKIEYVTASYFMNEDGKFGYTYQEFVLRQDASGKWKILTFYQIKGEDSDGK